jgi:hypothetical protein
MGASNIRRTAWDVTWNSVALGLVDEVNPDLKLMMEPITAGTFGKITLGHRIIGLEGKVSVVVREVILAKIKALAAPWWSTGSVPIAPETFNSDSYALAQLLTLHPHDVAAGTTDQDLTLVKTVPLQPYRVKRDGTKDDMWSVDFEVYPDRSQMEASPPKLVYGYIGPVPA